MKHDVPSDAVRSDEFVNYTPAMPNLSGESNFVSRTLGRLFGRK